VARAPAGLCTTGPGPDKLGGGEQDEPASL